MVSAVFSYVTFIQVAAKKVDRYLGTDLFIDTYITHLIVVQFGDIFFADGMDEEGSDEGKERKKGP